ncbi:Rab3 GTPase-activating protein catalytic subunit [Orchesella cincta]|uniref:Rab3 GTPase-activating protein catalytic subunit n=1 Tax=Orchesella cincta TaxID=48709 RepID=A0A1D2NF76_ORCCI|nr:Rab3 GTPase-activating protein catalytic subunit [Orchesella cincta]
MDVDDQFEDFTTASDWEQFTARLEQLLTEWLSKPVEPENVTNNWVDIQEKVTFSDFPFNFSYYRRVTDAELNDGNGVIMESTVEPINTSPSYPPYILRMLSSEPDFPPRSTPCPVSEFFSLEEFAVLSSTAAEPVHKESRLKLLLSSACIALNNTSCNFPIFGWNQNYFYGVAENGGVRTAFQMIRLKSVMISTYLSGLLDVFKSKIGQSLSAPIIITAHFFYNMNTWHEDFTYDSFPPELFDVLNVTATGGEADKDKDSTRVSIDQWSQLYSNTSIITFGSLDDIFINLQLICGWPALTDDIVVDSNTYTDFDAENAPEWFMSLNLDANAEFRLRDMIDGIWNLNTEFASLKDILGKCIDENEDTTHYTSALDRLTSDPVSQLPVAGINTVLGSAHRRLLYSPSQYSDLPPISSENMDVALRFLFPDAEPNPSLPYPSSFDRIPDLKKDATTSFWENLQGVKSAPIGSLVWRLATLIGNLHAYNGGNMAVAHMWTEFVLELRYRLEKSVLICGLQLDQVMMPCMISSHVNIHIMICPVIWCIVATKSV